MNENADPFERLADIFEEAGVRWVLIGGHAVNAWLPPRATADIDVTIATDAHGLERIRAGLARRGYVAGLVMNEAAASGPDFLRFAAPHDEPVVELQAAKTDFQVAAVGRGQRRAGAPRIPIATIEDLLVFKLIADREKDQADLRGLAALPRVDWAYVEEHAATWGFTERLVRLRSPRPTQ